MAENTSDPLPPPSADQAAAGHALVEAMAEPLAADWAEGLRAPVRASGLPAPRPLSARTIAAQPRSSDAVRPSARESRLGAAAAFVARPHAAASVEAPEGWATAEDELARADTIIGFAPSLPHALLPPEEPADQQAGDEPARADAPEQVLQLEAADEILGTVDSPEMDLLAASPDQSELTHSGSAHPEPAPFEPAETGASLSANAASQSMESLSQVDSVPDKDALVAAAETERDTWVEAFAQAIAQHVADATAVQVPALIESVSLIESVPPADSAAKPWSGGVPAEAAQAITATLAAEWAAAAAPSPQPASTWSMRGALEAELPVMGAAARPELSVGDEDLLVPVDPVEEDVVLTPGANALPGASPLFAAGEHRVAVHTRAGATRRGMVRDVDLAAPDFSLSPQGGGAPEPVQLSEVKAVFFMLSPGEMAEPGQGAPVRVTFLNGRTIEGRRDGGDAPSGFFLVPADGASTNTRRIFIARAAAQEVRED